MNGNISSITPATNSFMFSKMLFTASLNHSHLLYRATSAATSAAIANTTIVIGLAAMTLFRILQVSTTFFITPTALLNISNTGAIAVTSASTIATVFFCPSVKLLNLFVSSFTVLVTLFIAGCNACNATPAKSLPASFKLFNATVALSHGSSVLSYVSCTTLL